MLSKVRHIFYSNELKARFARGGIVLGGASVFDVGLRFLRNVVLTRILAPEYFGHMATIMSAVAVSEAFTEVGVRQSVIHNRKGDTSEFLNAAWWFSCMRGVIMYTIALAAAPLISAFFDAPELLFPMRIAFSALLLHGLVSPRMHVLEKKLNYFKLIVIRQGSAVLNVLVAITLSFYIKSIWPLVIGFTLENFARFIFSFFFLPFRPKIPIDRYSFYEILQFAKRMFGLPILSTFFFQFDIFVIGRMLNMEQLGLYSVARTFALFPVTVFAKTVKPLVLPVFSKLQDSPVTLGHWLMKMSDLTCLIFMPLISLCIVNSNTLLSLLYGPQYGAVWIAFSILMGYIFLRLLSTIMMQLFLGLGRPDLQRWFAFFRVLAVFLLAYPLTIRFGLIGTSSTVLVAMLFLFIPQVKYSLKLTHLNLGDYTMCLVRGLIFSAIIVSPGLIVRVFFQSYKFLPLVVCLLLCIVTWSIAFNTSRYKIAFSGKKPGHGLPK